MGCLHDRANVQHYICWKFAGRLLGRINTPSEASWRRGEGGKGAFEHPAVLAVEKMSEKSFLSENFRLKMRNLGLKTLILGGGDLESKLHF